MMILLKHRGTRATTDVTVIGTAFGFASIAEFLGLNPIVGAFTAGMGLPICELVKHVREYVDTLKYIAAPLFFAVIGAHVDLENVWSINPLFFLCC